MCTCHVKNMLIYLFPSFRSWSHMNNGTNPFFPTVYENLNYEVLNELMWHGETLNRHTCDVALAQRSKVAECTLITFRRHWIVQQRADIMPTQLLLRQRVLNYHETFLLNICMPSSVSQIFQTTPIQANIMGSTWREGWFFISAMLSQCWNKP